MTYIENHVARGLARLTESLKGKAKVAGWLTAILGQVQALEDAIEDVREGRDLLFAVGEQLDVWGRRLSLSRGGLSDEVYRIRLRAKLSVNRSSGTLPELLAILSLITDERDVAITESYPMGIDISVGAPLVDAGTAFEWLLLIREARMAAVRVFMQWLLATPETTFHVNSSTAGQRLNEGFLAGAGNP